MNDTPERGGDFAGAFDTAFGRLRAIVLEACGGERDWPAQVAAGLRAALGFAAADQAAAQLLTNEALARGAEGIACRERLIGYFAAALLAGRAERPEGAYLPEINERAMAGGVVTLVAQRLDRGEAGELPDLVPEAIQFVLTPYLGATEARRIGAEHVA